MAKPDGRIEKGQRLGSAISARAWNRAQDAADIVLGVRPGFSVPQTTQHVARTIVPMQKSINNWFAVPGMAVVYTGLDIGVGSASWNQFGTTDTWPITEASWSSTMSSISDLNRAHWARQSNRTAYGFCQPLGPDGLEESSDEDYGNIQDMIGIVTEPSAGNVVNVCISGPAVALVRVLTVTQLSSSIIRSAIKSRILPGIDSLNSSNDLRGILDIVRGGSIRVAEVGTEIFYGQSGVYPQIRLAEVFL